MVQGLSFYFRVNGKDIFMKGSNWIPAHVLPGNIWKLDSNKIEYTTVVFLPRA